MLMLLPHRSDLDRLSTASLPIGMFDSGLGGLTVWREIRRQLPQESILYFGDTARVPYGVRTPAEILQFVEEILAWMLAHPVKLIVMACGTSSALALDHVRSTCPVPILGLILPGARAAVQTGSRIGVIATPATVSSHTYRQAILESSGLLRGEAVECWEQACPEFVPLIESGQIQSPALLEAAHRYLDPLIDAGMDTLVYGCTHYPLLDPILQSFLPASIQRVDPAVALVEAVAQELDLWGLRRDPQLPGAGETQFCVSGDPESFARLAVQWIGWEPRVDHVEWQAFQTQAKRLGIETGRD